MTEGMLTEPDLGHVPQTLWWCSAVEEEWTGTIILCGHNLLGVVLLVTSFFIRVKCAGYFVKFDKIWPFIDLRGAAQRSVYLGKGPPEGAPSVQNGVEDAGRGGNPGLTCGVDEGIDRAGLVPVKERRRVFCRC